MSSNGGAPITLVLHGLLRRWLEEEKGAIIEPQIRDDAELRALNSVYCTLETILSEPFAAKAFPENSWHPWGKVPNYPVLVEQARQKVREEAGDWPRRHP